MDARLHYLDHAATSALRPAAVAEAMSRYLLDIGATPGRAGHTLAVEAGRIVLRARKAVQRHLGVEGDPGRVVFGSSATWGLNTALQGLVEPGDVIVQTIFDHNAALRPAAYLARTRGAIVRLVGGDPDGQLDRAGFAEALEGARIVTLNAASNVLGTCLPVADLVREAHAAGALVLVDSAQSLGHAPFDFGEADLVAFTGHKGLLGPQGIGGLWVRPGLEVPSPFQGGTGGNAHERSMPTAMPAALEPGTLNGPGIAGLLAGCEALDEVGVSALHQRLGSLKQQLAEGVDQLDGVRRLSPTAPEGVGIVTCSVDGVAASEVARILDRDFGVLTRAGLHCAPEVHRLLGTLETGGLRMSVGWGSSEADVDAALEALERVIASTQN